MTFFGWSSASGFLVVMGQISITSTSSLYIYWIHVHEGHSVHGKATCVQGIKQNKTKHSKPAKIKSIRQPTNQPTEEPINQASKQATNQTDKMTNRQHYGKYKRYPNHQIK